MTRSHSFFLQKFSVIQEDIFVRMFAILIMLLDVMAKKRDTSSKNRTNSILAGIWAIFYEGKIPSEKYEI